MPSIQTSFNLDAPTVSVRATGVNNPYEHVEVWNRCAQTREKNLGKVSTPQGVASIMAKWVTAHSPKSVMDPAVGLGSLLLECEHHQKGIELVGVEKDADTLEQARKTAPAGTRLIAGDYLKMHIVGQDAIIANPPYVKAQFLAYSDSEWRLFEESFGIQLDGSTNLYALFLLKIFEDLAEHGRAALIIPAEFLNANFGRSIKEHLLTRIKPAAIAVFDPSVQVFDSALTTSCIVFIEKPAKLVTQLYAIRSDSDLETLMQSLSEKKAVVGIDASRLSPNEKWLNLLFSPVSSKTSGLLKRKVGEYFKCRRGIATGSNEYFCLSANEIKSFGLSISDFDRCITKASHAEDVVFGQSDFQALVLNDKKCFLLNPKDAKTPTLEAYLKKGESEGIPQKHLPLHRPVWYLPENRSVAEIFASVFSRERPKFLLNSAGVKNLTCYHGLYGRQNCWKSAILMTVFLNTSLALESFSGINRFYGGGLKKVEPKDVESMACPNLPDISDEHAKELLSLLNALHGKPDAEVMTVLDEVGRKLFL